MIGLPVLPMIVRHERREGRKGLEVCNCLIDEGWPLGTGLQEQVPNHLPLLQSKAVVVSREGEGPARPGQVTSGKKNESEPPFLMSKRTRRYQNRGLSEGCGISFDETCLRAERYPAYRWPEPGGGG